MIRNYLEFSPKIGKKVYVDQQSAVIGKVTLEENVSIWPFASLRGDMNKIFIGKNSNIQDNSSLHTTLENVVEIGDNVTVGHRVVIHGAKIGNNSLIGMGAVILDDAVIGDNCLIGAGALVTPRTVIPDNSLVLGSPAKVIRTMKEEEIQGIKQNSLDYVKIAHSYL